MCACVGVCVCVFVQNYMKNKFIIVNRLTMNKITITFECVENRRKSIDECSLQKAQRERAQKSARNFIFHMLSGAKNS